MNDLCICGHDFAAHEHPSKPWMAINAQMMDTELGRCKLCTCHHWREIEALRDDYKENIYDTESV